MINIFDKSLLSLYKQQFNFCCCLLGCINIMCKISLNTNGLTPLLSPPSTALIEIFNVKTVLARLWIIVNSEKLDFHT